MAVRKLPTIRYRCATHEGSPLPGHIIMGDGPRVRRAYRVLSIRKTKALPGLGTTTWCISVEPMSAAAGRTEIDEGTPSWGIQWDSRKPRQRHV